MKKYLLLLPLLLILTNCINPEGRSWIIPVTIDDSILSYTPEQMEGFAKRRAEVFEKMEPGYLILKSLDQQSHNRHEFRTNNYFYYLSGYAAYDSYLVLEKIDNAVFILTLPPQNLRREIYEGGQASSEDLQANFGADMVLSSDKKAELFQEIIGSGKAIYVDRKNRELMDEMNELAGESTEIEFRSAASILDEMRVIKQDMEVERIQKACNITSRALTRVMKECGPGLHEYEMEAIIEGTYLEYGSAMPGFSSIVGSGPNSTVLHYEPNTRIMEDGELLLMDVGADYGHYTADISRTIPVSGKFSREQRTIYQLVLDAQKAAIEQMKPGKRFREGHNAGREVMARGLSELGLITDPESRWQIEFYCIHGSSHYLGMDVHDVGDYMGDGDNETGRILEPGMVLTIEPGIYIREKGLDQVAAMFASQADSAEIATFVEQVKPVFEKYLNIGVRIEDDVLITHQGNLVLSRYAPKEVEDIEQLMR